MSKQKPILDELQSWSVPHAIDALRKCDGSAFGSSAGSSGRNLGLVFDNMELLIDKGMYEAALIAAFSLSCKTNFHHWQTSVIRFMFDAADRNKLQSLGTMIPKEPIIAYRGVAGIRPNRHVQGLSWTLSKDMACWFAMRFSLGNPTVYKCVFNPEDVYVIHNERDEDELIGLAQKPVNCKLTHAQMSEGFARIIESRQKDWLEMVQKHENALSAA